jgi:preprotein translocase subunit Sec61beta
LTIPDIENRQELNICKGDLLKKDLISLLRDNGLVKFFRSRISGIQLTHDLIVRVRIVLILTAVLALFLAFEMGDDWYVREFARYEWARHIGY